MFLFSCRELHYLWTGKVLDVQPGPACDCPTNYPVFQRWPHDDDSLWRGMNCRKVAGTQEYMRVHHDSHVPQLAADEDTSTYWLSNGSTPLSRLNLELGTTYQVGGTIKNSFAHDMLLPDDHTTEMLCYKTLANCLPGFGPKGKKSRQYSVCMIIVFHNSFR